MFAYTGRLSRAVLSPRLLCRPATVRPASIRAQIAVMSSISEAITSDHREIKRAYDEVVNSWDVDHQTRFGNQFTWELARHSVAEELILYPAFEKYLGHEGKAIADKDRAEHHEVRKVRKMLIAKLTLLAGQRVS
jgi:hemerythrin superfamily protein